MITKERFFGFESEMIVFKYPRKMSKEEGFALIEDTKEMVNKAIDEILLCDVDELDFVNFEEDGMYAINMKDVFVEEDDDFGARILVGEDDFRGHLLSCGDGSYWRPSQKMLDAAKEVGKYSPKEWFDGTREFSILSITHNDINNSVDYYTSMMLQVEEPTVIDIPEVRNMTFHNIKAEK